MSLYYMIIKIFLLTNADFVHRHPKSCLLLIAYYCIPYVRIIASTCDYYMLMVRHETINWDNTRSFYNNRSENILKNAYNIGFDKYLNTVFYA